MPTPGSSSPSEAPSRSVKTLSRGLEILQLFADGPAEMSQSEIAAKCALPMPTVHRLVGTLVSHGFLTQVAGGRNLRLGDIVLVLAGRLASSGNAVAVIRQRLHELSTSLGETTNFAVLLGESVVYLDGVTGPRILTPQAAVGERISAHNTALGKALLAQLDDDAVKERIGEGPYQQTTKLTAGDWPELKKRLDEVRSTGISISDEEYEIGLTSIAIGLPALEDGTIRAINVSLPTSRASKSFRTKAMKQLRDAADSMTASTTPFV